MRASCGEGTDFGATTSSMGHDENRTSGSQHAPPHGARRHPPGDQRPMQRQPGRDEREHVHDDRRAVTNDPTLSGLGVRRG